MTLWTSYLLKSIIIGANIIQTASLENSPHSIDKQVIYKHEKAKYVCKEVFLKRINKNKPLDIN